MAERRRRIGRRGVIRRSRRIGRGGAFERKGKIDKRGMVKRRRKSREVGYFIKITLPRSAEDGGPKNERRTISGSF